MKKTFVFLMMVFTLLCITTVSASAESISWAVDAEGTLTISGSGAMEDYTSDSAVPWFAEDIYAVTVEEGITHVGNYAFSGLFLDNVLLPESLESIGENAFNGAAVTEAHFAGNLKQWRENVTLGDGNDVLTDIIVWDKDVTYQGEGFSLANGVVTSTVSALPGGFKREYNDYVFEVVFVGVAEIGKNACGGINNDSLTNMTSVMIPDGVTNIGTRAFQGCCNLTDVKIPDNVTRISDIAFADCSSLTNVTIPNNVTNIGGAAFTGCSSLTSITIPESVGSIGDEAFRDCISLTSVTIGYNVTSIGDSAFMGCSSLTDVKIPDGVTRIGYNVFYNCSSLTSVTIPDSVTSIESYAFYNCNSLMNVTIPDSVTSIGFSAFYGCNSLTSVTIGSSVTSIGYGAFQDCSSLTSVTIPDSVTSIEFELFYGCSRLMSVTIPDSVTSIGFSAFYGCSGLTSVTIGSSVTSIGGSAFSDCSSLTSVTIGSSVTSIGGSAFSDCSSLTSVTIPDSVTSIEARAFYDCNSLQNVYYTGTAVMWDEITIGDDNEYLINAARHCAVAGGETGGCRWSLSESGTLQISGNGCMADYTEGAAPWYTYHDLITDLIVKKGVKNLGNNAFCDLAVLESVTGLESVTSIGTGAFKNCVALEGLSIPSAVTSVGQNAFKGCTMLTSAGPVDSGAAIEFGWNKTIPADAFSGADCLESLTIPEGVTRIMASAIKDCTALTDVSLPSTLSNIQQNAFSGCTALTSITLSDALKTLGASAFQSTGLTSVTIPNGVTSIGNQAFANCSLTNVYYSGSQKQWNAITIGTDNTPLTNAEIHFSLFDISIDEEITNGSVTAVLDNEIAENAAEGDVIVLRIVPSEGYEIAENSLSVTYTDADNQLQSVVLTQGAGEEANTWSFAMPAYNVDVTVAFSMIQYTVTFVDEDGTVLKAATQYGYGTAAEAIEKPADPTREATAQYTYTFTGWTPEIAEVTEDATYTATYSRTARIYTITFDTDGGSTIEAITQAYDTPITAPANPTKEDLIFAKWEPALPATMPAENLTVKAVYVSEYGTPDFTLPAFLKTVEENAFEGASMTVVYVPDTCTSVGKEAFKNCENLTQIRLPKNCAINEHAFDGCTALTAIYAPAGGTTEQWCKDNPAIPFVAE